MKRAASYVPHFAKKAWVIGSVAALLVIAALLIAIIRFHQPATANTPFTPEQLYYQDMIYAVNEMNNQITEWNGLQAKGELEFADLEKPAKYVRELMSKLTSPPEELIVAQSLAEDLYAAYQQYVKHLSSNSPNAADSYEQAVSQYDKFLDNANLIAMLSAYSGLDVICH